MGRSIKVARGSGTVTQRRPDVIKSVVAKPAAAAAPPTPVAVVKPAKLTAASIAKRARKAQRRKRLVIKDIKRCQGTSELLTSRSAFARIVRDILRENNGSLRLQPEAIDALRVSTENAVAEAMARANEVAVGVAGREGVLLRDLQFSVSTFPHFTPRAGPP
jgi:histone H3/H4